MKSYIKVFLYGLVVWAVPAIVSFSIFSIRETERPLFESIMPLALTLITVFMANIYFKHVEINFVKEGIYLGIVWFVLSVIIDQFLFSMGPMKMSVMDYIKDIGITYLIIPAITVGTGWAEEIRFKKFIKWIPPAH